MIKQILGILLIILGTLDGIKYLWFGQKIKRTKSSNSYSRKGMNFAILNDIVRIIYGIYIFDLYIIISSLFASITMTYCWIQIYRFYPYRMRGCYNFRRPNIFIYFINSLLPNHLRKRL